jgi:two-component system, OmpR family, response regulator MprA
MSERVLVVDDEPSVRQALGEALRFSGYDVVLANDGVAAIAALRAAPVDALILDLVMPRIGGLQVCQRLRADGDRVPILVLTARDAVADRVAGLDAGADDYLVKPFALDELLARLRALLRRARPDAAGDELSYADLRLQQDARRAYRGGRSIDLTRTEFALLELFLRNAGQVLSREVISDRIWGYELSPASNSLEVFIKVLRRKTEAGGEQRLLQTVRGFGYALRVEP